MASSRTKATADSAAVAVGTMKSSSSSSSSRIRLVTYFFWVVCFFAILTFYVSIQQTNVPLSTAAATDILSSWKVIQTASHASTSSNTKGTKGVISSASINMDSEVNDDVDDVEEEQRHELHGLSCQNHGGPPDDNARAVQEMIYWENIPQDNQHVSPFHHHYRADGSMTQQQQQQQQQYQHHEYYLTFEPDHGGWNNIRMAMETVLAIAVAMGRTLVLPPEQPVYLLNSPPAAATAGASTSGTDTNNQKRKTKQQQRLFDFNDFFHMDAIHDEHAGLNIITMEQYLIQARPYFRYRNNSKTGNDPNDIAYPPGNRTNWNGAYYSEMVTLYQWLKDVSLVPYSWDPEKCLATFPATTSETDVKELQRIASIVKTEDPYYTKFIGKPFPVNASTTDRLRENWAERKHLCIYTADMHQAMSIHFGVDRRQDTRLLVHFYAFVFFQSWQQDLWMKRFIRDHVRYTDEIMCAAARVVAALRQRVQQRRSTIDDNDSYGHFDSMHGT
jgi:hypothetical protein